MTKFTDHQILLIRHNFCVCQIFIIMLANLDRISQSEIKRGTIRQAQSLIS